MTELIVALDAPDPWRLFWQIQEEVPEVAWFKLGPQAMASVNFTRLVQESRRVNLFLDLKLIDTEATVREAIQRMADAGVAAVSVMPARVEAALEGAKGSQLRVWELIALSDTLPPSEDVARGIRLASAYGAHGVIVPPFYVDEVVAVGYEDDVVCPAVRLDARAKDGHVYVSSPQSCVRAGVTHAVVGRPIWRALDPVAACRAYLDALK